ncbi:SpoIID/LytB domain-containing protein [Candidatus Epulonipiscium viviparus]|uniref:SpoIID/LytB domain-containing protein n=1 Tax=Candidatus Epulonipiscium viviparus TaxID=420336 RepID=UPI0027381285|nr:SpoIID/LytB domain-containing protein [Candidatus Epulopiscium viviparus]
MKRIVPYLLILFGCLIFLPIFMTFIGGHHHKNILFTIATTDAVEIVDYDELLQNQIIGMLAQEVNYTEPMEYIKVNAIIFRTYLTRSQLGYGIQKDLLPLTTQQMKDKFGSNYDKAYSVYLSAVTSTEDIVIYHDDELIEPVYHASSAGNTRDSIDFYGIDIAYLQSVPSPVDATIKELQYTTAQAIDMLKSNFPDIVINETYLAQQIQIVDIDDSGYITAIQFGSSILNEQAFLQTFGLTSSHVEISVQDGNIIFRQHGDGTGVGLSQNGAKEYAKLGNTYEVILKYYYFDTEIKKINK